MRSCSGRPGLDADIALCARESVLDLVPRVVSADIGVSLVVGRAPSRPTRPTMDIGATVEV